MKNIIWATALICSPALAGDFSLTHEDSSGYWFTYEGTVEDHDSTTLHEIMTAAEGENVFITINSGGGSAFGGLSLFWEAERWSNLTTIAGQDYGAWSAAAMFWLGSPRDWFEGAGSKVGFHQAYCDWWRPPGCDITAFRVMLVDALYKAGLNGYAFDQWLTAAQQGYGVSAWALLTDEGWHFHEHQLDITYPITPTWTY